MRPIKFRGRRIDNGEFVYGVYVKSVPMSSFPGIVDDDDYIHDVDPDSIAQLVGYDVDGKEVYEGDTLIDDDGQEFVASLQGIVRWVPADKSICADMPDSLKTMPFDFAQQHTPLTLKGQAI